MQRDASRKAFGLLRELLGDRLAMGEAVRRQHANTVSWLATEPPDAVAWPETEDEVAQILTIANGHRLPVIAYGAGTSLEGQVNAPLGGLSLDLSRLGRIVSINVGDLDAEVEAGVTRRTLNEQVRDTGLFFAVDPGAEDATLGGMAATRASGTTTVRYGTMRDNIIRLTAVMADGSIVRTGGRARKSAAGYDLTQLLVGSEGTLGIITRLAVRLHPVPESVLAAVTPFASVEGACGATVEAMQAGLPLARIELLDAVQMRAINLYAQTTFAELPTLFVEFHGSPGATHDCIVAFNEIAERHGASGLEWAEGEGGRRRLWKARHDAFWAVRAAWPGKSYLATDVCVPISRLAACVAETAEDIRKFGLTAPIVGHVGDGNFHAIPVIDPNNAAEVHALEAFMDRLVARAIAMDGTCTGEHGIGQGKARYLKDELGGGVEVMRAIKTALDPNGILNPGKLLLP